MVNVRYAAANRDRGFFDHADELNLDRPHPRAHVAFGLGTHYCLGAALARRELIIGFDAVIKRLEGVRFAAGVNDFRHQPNFCLRALKALYIEFAPRPT
jgi:cytochrome P450